MTEALSVVVYSVGWLLWVAAQAQNSVSSRSNGLPNGWAGISIWLKLHAVNLATRAFFSAIFYGLILHTVTAKVQGVGMPITSTTIAGIGGYSANALLYQFFGLFPFMRVEVSDLAPPPNSQIVPLSQANSSSEKSQEKKP